MIQQGSLYFDYYYSPHPGTSGYAVVFNRENQAIHLSGGIYVLNPADSAFVTGNQGICAIHLNMDRLDHISNTIPCTGLSLPASAEGDLYTTEYWLTSGSYNRAIDTLLGTQNFYWDGNYQSEQRIAITQKQTIAALAAAAFPQSFLAGTYLTPATWGNLLYGLSASLNALSGNIIAGIENDGNLGLTGRNLAATFSAIVGAILSRAASQFVCQFSIAYDSVNNVATYCAWLEQDGQLVTTVTNCTVTWLTSLGAIVYNGNSTSSTAGFFFFTQSNPSLTPGVVTRATVQITDSLGNTYTTASSPVSWD